MTKTSHSLFRSGAVAVMLSLLFASCSPKIVGQLQTSDTTYVHKTDSVYVRDSIYIDRTTTIKEKGDTVFVTKTLTEYRDRWHTREKTDTVYVDKVRFETYVEEVEKPDTKFEKLQKGCFWAFCGMIILALAYLAFRLWKKLKK